jgi:DNA-binding NtrC family response regulator
MLKPRVLIVEDDPDTRITMEALLSDQFEVKDTASREEALAALQMGYVPSCVLMDYCMPGMPLECFLQESKIYNLELLLITAHSNARQIAEKFGIKHVLIKPVRPDELPAAVKEVIAHGEHATL